MEREFFPLLLERGARFFGFVSPGYWVDIGTPTKYFQAQQDLLAGRFRAHVAPRGREGPEGWIHPTAIHRRHGADPRARGHRSGCQIEAGAAVGPSVVLGAGCRIGAGAQIDTGGALGRGRGGHGRAGSRDVSSDGACRSAPTPASRPVRSWATARASATIPASPGIS